MLYSQWEDIYYKIVDDLKLDIKLDEKAAEVLQYLLYSRSLVPPSEIKELIEGREVVIFGAGESLLNSIRNNKSIISRSVKITADGATTALLENNMEPDIIVSDLDGRVLDQIYANNNGSIMIVHAHGDNIDKLYTYVPLFKGDVFGTIQVNPDNFSLLHNYGGFTDGDRAVFLADHFKAKKIYLLGFDPPYKIGRYSFTDKKNIELKRKKLEWCYYLINQLDNDSIRFIR